MNGDSPRVIHGLAREVAILQLKLLIEAFRDLLLSPMTLFAALLDALLHKQQSPRYFHAVLRFGERSDEWIDMWSAARQTPTQPGSVDALLENVEAIVKDPQVGAHRARVLKRWLSRQATRARQRAAAPPTKSAPP